jgi:cytoskeleton protein RodZ
MSESTDIGDTLRNAREGMGLSLPQAAERLHVDAVIVDALETGRFAALGAPVFVRGHLRRYAELLGVSEAELQAQYAALQEASIQPDLTAVPHLPVLPPSRGPVRWQLVALAVILVLAAVAWWALQVKVS